MSKPTRGVGLVKILASKYSNFDRPIIENGLPAHLQVLASLELKKHGWNMRADVLHHLNVAAAAALAKLPTIAIGRCAKHIDEMATIMLSKVSPDDPRDAMLVCAFFTLKLIEEGLWEDAKNSAVIAAIHVMEDAKDDANWLMNEGWLEDKAKEMLSEANKVGLYIKTLEPMLLQ